MSGPAGFLQIVDDQLSDVTVVFSNEHMMGWFDGKPPGGASIMPQSCDVSSL
jgi:hypothetical protein